MATQETTTKTEQTEQATQNTQVTLDTAVPVTESVSTAVEDSTQKIQEIQENKPIKKSKKMSFDFSTFLKKRKNALSVFGTSPQTDWLVVLTISGICIAYVLIQGFSMYRDIVNDPELDPVRASDSVQLKEKDLQELLSSFEKKNRVLRGIGGVVETVTEEGDEDEGTEEAASDVEAETGTSVEN